MENIEFNSMNEKEKKKEQSLDVTEEFLNMDEVDFLGFLRKQKDVSSLKIEFDWVDIFTARKAKAFVESAKIGQQREAKIRATKEQMSQEINVFESGVEWEEVK